MLIWEPNDAPEWGATVAAVRESWCDYLTQPVTPAPTGEETDPCAA